MAKTGITSPQRYDFVGSFLRPQKLKEAKEKYANEDLRHWPKYPRIRRWYSVW